MSRPRFGSGWMIAVGVVFVLSCVALAAPPTQARSGMAPRPPAPDWAAPHAARQLLVKLSDASASSADVALAATGVRVIRTIPQLNLALVETDVTADLAAAADLVGARPGIEWVEPNYTFTPDSTDFVPDDPEYFKQTAYLDRLQMPAAWDVTTGNPQVIVAILDTGLDMTHPDLQGGVWTNPREIPDNGLDDDANGFVDDVHGWNFPDGNGNIYDDHGHGTHVAGIAAARINNGIGIAGMAGGVTIMPVDVFGGGIGTYEDLIRAIIYATDNGARVINMSLGASSYSVGEAMAVNYAVDHGAVPVAAAGNTGTEAYHYPAAHPAVIAVAATTASDARASFSTRGDWVDVAAPGSSIYATYPNSRYIYMSGTSMATPHVSGLAALILSVNPLLTPDKVRGIIEGSADDLGSAGRDISFGWGRINAARALALVAPGVGPTVTPPAPLPEWPAGCIDLIADGGFEDGRPGAWRLSGDVQVDTTRAYAGAGALHFLGGPSAAGEARYALAVPARWKESTLWFAYRIENYDAGTGTTPAFPYDDFLTASFVITPTGGLPVEQVLLSTGNSADTAFDGLPWDRYLYQTPPGQETTGFDAPVELVFRAGNDNDSLPTDFWVDAVRLCVTGEGWPTPTPSPTSSPTATPTATRTLPLRLYLPLIIG